jgi:uncharacterized membrane protein
MHNEADPIADREPPSAEFSLAWAAYVLHGVGAVGFFPGPLVGLSINYSRRGADGAGFIASHHRWLIRTAWWTLAGYLLCLGIIIAGVWPLVADVVREAIRTGGDVQTFAFSFEWEAIFLTAGAAMLGGLGLFCLWAWFVYRIVRGALRLADARPAT